MTGASAKEGKPTLTPFGKRIRELRAERGVTQKDMAAAIGVSTAYLSALELGQRGLPAWYLVQRIIAYFNVIWDEAGELERLAQISHPRVRLDTEGLGPEATELANRFARRLPTLSPQEISAILAILDPATRLRR